MIKTKLEKVNCVYIEQAERIQRQTYYIEQCRKIKIGQT